LLPRHAKWNELADQHTFQWNAYRHWVLDDDGTYPDARRDVLDVVRVLLVWTMTAA
jgi:hypothetical protein